MSTRWSSGAFAKRMAGMWAVLGGICWSLGLIFAILGVIAETTDAALGLEPMSWFMLAIALFAASIAEYIGWAVGVLYKE
ncbi:MAG: hypothetical protein KAV68_06975 [Dehalococcoidales bacterium]|nr:hypothetical protein [Dehalococcoidales bacterium]